MCPPSLIFWCYVLLLIVLFSESWGNSIDGDKQNNTSTTQSNLFENFLKIIQRYNTEPLKAVVNIIRIALSLPFLLLTFVVYSILPKLQNLHGYTLRVHLASLFITNVIMLSYQEISNLLQSEYCIYLAYIINFLILACFSWLNIMSFDKWFTLRKYRRETIKNQGKKKFVMYSFYAWGITFIFNVVCATANYFDEPKNSQLDICKKPFLITFEHVKKYLLKPVSVMIGANICLFLAMTLTNLCYSKQTANQQRNSKNNRYKKKFIKYLMLFMVIGISWAIKMVLWIVNEDFILSIVLDIVNIIDCMQGPIIFIIYVCKKKILRSLKQYDWKSCNLYNSRNNDCPNPAPNTTSIPSISETVVCTINQSNQQINHRAKCDETYVTTCL